MTSWSTVRAEVFNGGVDQLVWNHLAILPELIDAFSHVGAHGSAKLLVALGTELVEAEPELASASVVESFLQFRRKAEHWSDGGDLLSELPDAILRHARAHPEEYVLELVEEREWSDGVDLFRSRILRRPDGSYEIAIDKRVRFEGTDSTPWFWSELPRPAEVAQTLDAARSIEARERASRASSPKELRLSITECSSMLSTDGSYRLWPGLSIDRLPQDLPLLVRLQFPDGEETSVRGRFQIESIGRTRCRGNVVLDPDARLPRDERPAYTRPWWGSGWEAECRVE